MFTFRKSATHFISHGGIKGLTKIFLRRDIKKTADEYGIPYEQVEKDFEKGRAENPGKNMVIVFSQLNEEPPILIIEEREAHFDRTLEQLNRTGILTSAPI